MRACRTSPPVKPSLPFMFAGAAFRRKQRASFAIKHATTVQRRRNKRRHAARENTEIGSCEACPMSCCGIGEIRQEQPGARVAQAEEASLQPSSSSLLLQYSQQGTERCGRKVVEV